MNFSLKTAVLAVLAWLALASFAMAQVPAAPSPQSSPALPAAAQAQATIANASDVWARYPAGSIHSVDAADAALTAVDLQRARQDRAYIEQQRECYSRFFVSSCLKKIQDENRVVSKKIKTVEIEANTYLRQARADDRDAALAEQRAAELADAPRRAKEQQENAAENARKVTESAQRTVDADARARSIVPEPDRVAAHAQKMRELREGQAADAQKRIENAAAYDRKVEAAHKRQQEVADNKAAKQADQAAHAVQGGLPIAPAGAAPATQPVPKN